MTKGYIVKCEGCDKDYYCESTGNIWTDGKDHETATCPYCKVDGLSELLYTYKLEENGKPVR